MNIRIIGTNNTEGSEVTNCCILQNKQESHNRHKSLN